MLVACGMIAAAGMWWIGGAIAGDAPIAQPPDAHVVTAAARAGRHVRIEGPHGAVHAWIPRGYRPETGATIVYVHGYWDDADTAYVGHRLPEQFALSALNALFIVPEAPAMTKVPVNYPNLSELIRLVEDHTGVLRGMALTAAVGHSGAYRTIVTWLDEPLLDQVVLVDGMYGSDEIFAGWLRASPHHRLITVGEDTLVWNEQFLRDMPETFVVDRVPPTFDTWPAEARTSRIVYVRAQYLHMPLAIEGIVLPALLRLLPVELLADGPWQAPQGGMPPLPDAASYTPLDAAGQPRSDAL